MSRPSVTVVMPFAGDASAADAAVQTLLELDCRPGDELILADNAGVAHARGEVRIVRATAERSPAYARNAGAEQARGDWILFLDADCRAPSWLLDAYFAPDVAPEDAFPTVYATLGWVSRGALEYVCRRLSIPPADAYGVASFYARFALEERPPIAVHVCDDIACKCAGVDALCEALEKGFGPAGAPGASGSTAWYRSPCLGLCDRAPAALIERAGKGSLHADARIAPATYEEIGRGPHRRLAWRRTAANTT